MILTVSNILQYQSFAEAKVLSGNVGLTNEVSGVMVMEAPDIEAWGRSGQIILTSYFALDKLSDERIDLFFRKAKDLGISAFIFKKSRLLDEIPEIFIESCMKYHLPLIQIPKETSYEKIILEVLETIINRKAYLLNSYYDIHNHFVKMTLSEPKIIDVLKVLQQMIHNPVSLFEKIKGTLIATDNLSTDFKITSEHYLPKGQFMNFDYTQRIASYPHYDSGSSHTQLAVAIPSLGYEQYELIIHEINEPVSDIDFMAIENAVGILQTELVKHYSIKQTTLNKTNELGSDLLHGRIEDEEQFEDTLNHLNLDRSAPHRVVVFEFYEDESSKNLFSPLSSRFSDTIVNYAKKEFYKLVYVTRKQKVILILPADTIDSESLKKRLAYILKKVTETKPFSTFKVNVSISDPTNLKSLATAYKQAMDTQKIIHLINKNLQIKDYQDIGIYQIFSETNNLDQLTRFIPAKINQMHKDNLDLLHTLEAFLNVNQNYIEAAALLFVHPKTVRYRIEKIKNSYQIDFNNPEEILQLSIGLRLLKIVKQ